MSFKENIKVEEAFNATLDKNVWIKHEGKTAQGRIGDFYNTLLGINVDFKVDCYADDLFVNIVLEVNQVSGTNWIDELDPNSWIGYAKLNNGVIFYWKVSQLRAFRETEEYKKRMEIKSWSGTTFKNFRLSELPDYGFIQKIKNKAAFDLFVKKDVLGDKKYTDKDFYLV